MRNLAQRQSGRKQKRQLDLFTIVIYILVTLGAVLTAIRSVAHKPAKYLRNWYAIAM